MLAPRARLRLRPDRRPQDRAQGQLQPVLRGHLQRHLQAATPGYQDRITWDMGGCPAYGPSGPTADYRCPLSDRDRGQPPHAARSTAIDPTSSTRGSTSSASGFERAVRPELARRRRPASSARTRTSSATCCPTPAGRRSASPAPRARPSRTATTAARCRRRPSRPTAGPTVATSADNVLITNPDGFQYLRPERQRARDGERLPQVQGADARAQQALRRTAGRPRSRTCTRRPRARSTTRSRGPVRPERNFYETPTSALVNSDGRLTNDRPHELKVFVGYQIPKIEISVNATTGCSAAAPTRPSSASARARSTSRSPPTTSASAPAASRTSSRAAAVACRRRASSTCASRRSSTSAGSHRLAVFARLPEHHQRGHGDRHDCAGCRRRRCPLPPPAERRDDGGDAVRGAELRSWRRGRSSWERAGASSSSRALAHGPGARVAPGPFLGSCGGRPEPEADEWGSPGDEAAHGNLGRQTRAIALALRGSRPGVARARATAPSFRPSSRAPSSS